jgi:LAS superfamily LD-carboxypeptidase LdcB
MKQTSFTPFTIILLTLLILSLLVSLGLVLYRYRSTTVLLEYARQQISAQALTIRTLEQDLLQAKENINALMGALTEEQHRMFVFDEQIKAITGVVGTLDKLSKTDPELLKKYSKVYFLNENYAPATLAALDAAYLYPEDTPEYIHSQALPFLRDLLQSAHGNGVELRIISAYRSFDEQISIKSGYKFIYGAGTANQFSADQGYSEHQLGTTIDFTTPETGTLSSGFKKTPAYTWLLDHAHEYGFVLSYPEKNTYYTFEPWHWRFVGVALAIELHAKNIHFYDMDQRDIDAYLISIFDPNKN